MRNLTPRQARGKVPAVAPFGVPAREPADQLLQLARAVERLGWDRATPEQALAAKLHVRDELRRIAREIGR